jgi:hypothetical protein
MWWLGIVKSLLSPYLRTWVKPQTHDILIKCILSLCLWMLWFPNVYIDMQIESRVAWQWSSRTHSYQSLPWPWLADRNWSHSCFSHVPVFRHATESRRLHCVSSGMRLGDSSFRGGIIIIDLWRTRGLILVACCFIEPRKWDKKTSKGSQPSSRQIP